MFVFRLQYILIFIDWSESDILLNINTNTAQAVSSLASNYDPILSPVSLHSSQCDFFSHPRPIYQCAGSEFSWIQKPSKESKVPVSSQCVLSCGPSSLLVVSLVV